MSSQTYGLFSKIGFSHKFRLFSKNWGLSVIFQKLRVIFQNCGLLFKIEGLFSKYWWVNLRKWGVAFQNLVFSKIVGLFSENWGVSFPKLRLFARHGPHASFKAWAKVVFHETASAFEAVNNIAEPLQVAAWQVATYVDNLIELVDIPDVVGDIHLIQPLLATQKDPAKMLIWMEVFKRSVIKARPIQPFVKVCELLPVACSRTPHIFTDCTSFSSKPPPTIPTARALHTFVCDNVPTGALPSPIRKKNSSKTIQYAIEVVDCFTADILHNFNPLLMKIRAISQREKAIETTEYIRNYTNTTWSTGMEENEVVSWTKAPELKYNTSKATSMIYMPMKYACRQSLRIYGCVQEHTELEGPSVVNWLSRLPFRY